MGYFTGERAGLGIPVFENLKRPTAEYAKQLATCVNVPGSTALFHIPGVTPEAATQEEAFGGNKPKGIFVFDESAKRETYRKLSHEPAGKLDMVFLGCPHATFYEIEEVCRLLEGRRVAEKTVLWIMTSRETRAAAYRSGHGQLIEESGGRLFAEGCLGMYYLYYPLKRPALGRVATNAAKQAFTVRRSFGSNVCFCDETRCIEIAVEGGHKMDPVTRFKARKIVPGRASGPALVTRERLSFHGFIDPERGIFSSPVTELKGASFAGRVLIFTSGKGASAGPRVLDAACRFGHKPPAIVNLAPEAFIVQGCVMQDIPLVCVEDATIFDAVKNGDEVTVDANKGEVKIIRHYPAS